MIIIIDGYNILKNIYPQQYISGHQRANFIKQLTAYASKKQHSIVLVFDGGSSFHPYQEVFDLVTVVYSGTYQSADEYIKNFFKQHSKQSVLAVTSDRSIITVAKQCHIISMGALDFYSLLQDTLLPEPPKKKLSILQKISEDSNLELDALMESIDTVPYKKEDTTAIIRKIPKSKASKEERKLLQKLKKL